jgi:NAD(P)-dependent dehydrogenase (short-subunit alcohol dehydrogenase family)
MLLTIALILIAVIFCLALIKLYAKLSSGRFDITEDLSGKTVLITGATGGIGRYVAEELAKNGATVHLLCRNVQKAKTVADSITQSTGNDQVHVWQLDVSQLQSVRRFAADFLAAIKDPIDILINNAGVGWLRCRMVTDDHLELTMATNHFGHFLLTHLLMDGLLAADAGRIVNVSSIAHIGSKLYLDNINFERSYDMFSSYNISKLANILFTNELAKRLKELGTACTVNSLHPGSVDTDLFRHWPWYLQPLYALCRPFMKTVEEGAQCTLYVALAPELNGLSGNYY